MLVTELSTETKQNLVLMRHRDSCGQQTLVGDCRGTGTVACAVMQERSVAPGRPESGPCQGGQQWPPPGGVTDLRSKEREALIHDKIIKSQNTGEQSPTSPLIYQSSNNHYPHFLNE